MRYGNDLLKEISQPIIKIDKQIAELKAESDKLQSELDKNADNFDMNVVRASQKLEQDLSLIKTSLVKAQAYKKELMDSNAKKHYDMIINYIDEVREKEVNARLDSSNKVKELINEIHALYDEAKDYDNQIVKGIDELINSLQPYLSDKDIFAGGRKTASDRLAMVSNRPKRNNLIELNFFEQETLAIQGLIPPIMRLETDK